MIVAAILSLEAAFWVILGVALAARYLLHWRQLSLIMLWALPGLDAALLFLVTIDLHRGAEPTSSHALAASYLGFTIAFGSPLVSWADRTFAHRFARGPRPSTPAKGSRAHMRGLWLEWLRVVSAAAIATVVITFLEVVVRRGSIPATFDDAATDPLWAQTMTLGIVVVIWFLAGPAFARRKPRDDNGKYEP